MEEFLNLLLKQDFFGGLEVVVKYLNESKVIDGALFFDKSMNAKILAGGERIKGKEFEKIEGISKSSVIKAIEKGGDLFEDNILNKKENDLSIFYKISSVYVCPLYSINQLKDSELKQLLGILYFDRVGERRRFSESERLWFKLLRKICQKHFQMKSSEEFLLNSPKGWIGVSDFSIKLRKKIRTLSQLPVVTIVGETGVGKGLLAEVLHKESGRDGQFVVVNLPDLTETIFEAELFGSKKGAYTGAHDRKGLIGEAEGGTLFFDEISEIPFYLQAKLLRLIDTGFYKRLGEDKERKAKCHFICASNKDLYNEVKEGRFREDLYFRISAHAIKIPPLRERKEDIKEIARFYLTINGFSFNEKVLDLLSMHNYPGNVRELFNLLEELKYKKGTRKVVREKDIKELFQDKEMSSEDSEYLIEKIMKGELSWYQLKDLFLDREVSREEIRRIIINALNKTERKTYKDLCELLKIPVGEYGKFMAFLHRHKIV